MVVRAGEFDGDTGQHKRKRKRPGKAQRFRRKVMKVLHDETEGFEAMNPDAAGIDVGSEVMYVSVPPDRDSNSVQEFRSYTVDLERLADWLVSCGITTVAMEATGVYWIPLFQILEARGLEVCLVNARHAKNLPGRKTDVVDCQWLRKLHTFGLLSASFRPPDEICVLRSISRWRKALIEEASHHVLHMQQALSQMNVLVHKAVTDITGVTGLRITEAIINGQTDPAVLASFRDQRCKKSEAEITEALRGDFRREHLFILRQAFDAWQRTRGQMRDCDVELESLLGSIVKQTDEKPRPPKKAKQKPNDANFDLRTHLYQICGVDLTDIPGIDTLTTLTIVSEIGTDMTPWKTSGNFASWMGLCCDNKISGKRVLGVSTRRCANKVRTALRIAARSLHRNQSSLGAFFRRMKTKLSFEAAVTATAHKLARIIYAMLKQQQRFDPIKLDLRHEYAEAKKFLSVSRRAKQMGFKLVPIEDKSSTSAEPVMA